MKGNANAYDMSNAGTLFQDIAILNPTASIIAHEMPNNT